MGIEIEKDRIVQVAKIEPSAGFSPRREESQDPLASAIRLGLEKNVAELDAYGFTIVEPGRAAPAGFIEEIETEVLRVAERRAGVRPDLATGITHRDRPSPTGQHLFNLLSEGAIFERAILNEVALTLLGHLLGDGFLLSSVTAMLKGPGAVKLELHADAAPIPAPMPAYSLVANATWTLSDYSRENGSTCFWPGSHKFCRQPTAQERGNTTALVPIEAPAGSLIVWHGNTWHGAFARTAPGLRLNLITYFCRPFMQQQEWYRDKLPSSVFARNPARFAQLVGMDQPFPMGIDGPNPENFARQLSTARTPRG